MKAVLATLIFAVVTVPAIAGERQDRARAAAQAWSTCVQTKAQRFAPQTEPAETLVMAAMGLCVREAGEFRYLLRESTRTYGLPFAEAADDETISRGFTEIEKHIKNLGIAAVIEARSK